MWKKPPWKLRRKRPPKPRWKNKLWKLLLQKQEAQKQLLKKRPLKKRAWKLQKLPLHRKKLPVKRPDPPLRQRLNLSLRRKPAWKSVKKKRRKLKEQEKLQLMSKTTPRMKRKSKTIVDLNAIKKRIYNREIQTKKVI